MSAAVGGAVEVKGEEAGERLAAIGQLDGLAQQPFGLTIPPTRVVLFWQPLLRRAGLPGPSSSTARATGIAFSGD